MRGEYVADVAGAVVAEELPPRARRILRPALTMPAFCGTTSACAENTPQGLRKYWPGWNYLRVRGEYRSNHFFHASVVELPPRARRIRVPQGCPNRLGGTTSACAENTMLGLAGLLWIWNYLRVRGEYLLPFCLGIIKMELPPRARRIP